MTDAVTFLRSRGLDPATMTDRWRLDDNFMHEHKVRTEFIARFGFAILTPEVVAALRPYSPLLEVGSGSGYWAYELRNDGLDVIATDPGTGRYGGVPNGWTPWTAIERLTAVEAVRQYSERALLMIWPDYGVGWAADALDAYAGRYVLYVGEGSGGATADDRFHELLEKRLEEHLVVPLPVFNGLHDRLMVWRRLGEA